MQHEMNLEQMEVEIKHGQSLFLLEPLFDKRQNVLLGTEKELKQKDIDRIRSLFPDKKDSMFLVRTAVSHYIEKEKREKFAAFVVDVIKKDPYFRKMMREQREFILIHVKNQLSENDYVIWKLSSIRSFSQKLFLHTIRTTIFALSFYFVYNHQQNSGMLDAEVVRQLLEASFLHDLGYTKHDLKELDVKIMDRTEDQALKLNQHPIEGFKIIRQEAHRHNLEQPVIDAILNHEERMDGSGEPRGLGANDFDLITRILMVANYFEIIIEGHYSAGERSVKDYIRKIRSEKTKFDQDIITALTEVFRSFYHQG